MPEPMHNPQEKKGPPPSHYDVPPHILKELLEMREKIGRLEGMMEVLLRQVPRSEHNKLV
jgi:hypothetical protein